MFPSGPISSHSLRVSILGTMRLMHNCFSDPCDAAIAAADHEQSMKFIICLGPSEKIIVLQGDAH
jgi:hypothetical protein